MTMYFGDGSIVPNSDPFERVEFNAPDDIQCTGFSCNAMIPQKINDRNKIQNKKKLCNRCQNRIYRRSFKK